jgi:hypothetical protein
MSILTSSDNIASLRRRRGYGREGRGKEQKQFTKMNKLPTMVIYPTKLYLRDSSLNSTRLPYHSERMF